MYAKNLLIGVYNISADNKVFYSHPDIPRLLHTSYKTSGMFPLAVLVPAWQTETKHSNNDWWSVFKLPVKHVNTQCFVFLSILLCRWYTLPVSTCSTASLSNLSRFIVALQQTHSTIFKSALYIRELWRRVNVTAVFHGQTPNSEAHFDGSIFRLGWFFIFQSFSWWVDCTLSSPVHCSSPQGLDNSLESVCRPKHTKHSRPAWTWGLYFFDWSNEGKKTQGNLKWWPEAWYIQ